MSVNIDVSEETVIIIEKLTGMSIESFLDKVKYDLLNELQEKKKLSVAEAASIMGVSQQFVRIGLQRGSLPFGTAVKLSSIWTYYISPNKFYEYIGEKFSNNVKG